MLFILLLLGGQWDGQESPNWAPEAEFLYKHKASLGYFVLDDCLFLAFERIKLKM